MIALGDYRFQSDENPYETFQRSHTYRWPSQDRIGVYPILQYVGPGEHKVTLSGTMYPLLRGGIEQFELMMAEAGKGNPLRMVDGLGNVWGLWCITNITENYSYMFQDGLPRKIEFTMELTYYGEPYATPEGAPSNQNSNIGTVRPDDEQFTADREAYIAGRGSPVDDNPYQSNEERLAYNRGKVRRLGGDVTGDYGELPPDMTPAESEAFYRGFDDGGNIGATPDVTSQGLASNTIEVGSSQYASVNAARQTQIDYSGEYTADIEYDWDIGETITSTDDEAMMAMEQGIADARRGAP